MAIDPNSLPRDAETLRKIVVDLAEQLDRSLTEQNKYQSLLRELLEAQGCLTGLGITPWNHVVGLCQL